MYHKWKSYVWFLRYGAWQTEFFLILDHFLPYYPPNNPENQNFEKNEKHTCIIILHKCTKIMIISYTFLNILSVTDVIVIFSFWALFSPFTSLTPEKSKFEKSERTCVDIIILPQCTKNHDHMLYCSWHMARNGCNCYFSFWAIFCHFTFLATRKIKI